MPNIIIDDVEFQISKLNPAPKDGLNWIAVHPAVLKEHVDPLESADPNLHEPSGFSGHRDKVVAIAGGTDPDQHLNEKQAQTARDVAAGVEHYVDYHHKQSGKITVQRFAPGESEPHEFDLSQSQAVYIAASKDISFEQLSAIASRALTHVDLHLVREAELVPESEHAAALAEVLNPKKPGGDIKPAGRPVAKEESPESRLMGKIMKVLDEKAPGISSTDRIAITGGITKLMMDELQQLGEDMQSGRYKPTPPASGRAGK